ncbi:U3 small nucleolar RNA-interacting protein 2 isoform X2 [Hyalella azteca]|uniref:U3 small nucleolar RNA-interacting protein 2 isoform X2 n=1 Tax=Hyalella azteca TaxID=294128 RepID=A0A8B7NMI0_HYAAZ|nr:U3 small nucleolar RNA-interacting protein 2 isoform X2 [Hyalella azteca]
MPFFVKAKNNSQTKPSPKGRKERRKAKFGRESKVANFPKRKRGSKFQDEEIESSASSSDEEQIEHIKRFKPDDSMVPDSDEEHETAQEKKERLANEYIKELETMKSLAAEDADDKEQHSVSLQQQLREDVLKASGKLHKKVALTYAAAENHTISILQCKKFQWKTLTSIAINPTDNSIFSGSLDGSIVKYSIFGERLGVIKSFHQNPSETEPRHKAAVFALAISSNGKYLVSGDESGMIYVWEAETLRYVDKLKRHTRAVTGLVFRRGTLTLYSCSLDRLVFEWCLENMAFVDNLGGHSCGVLGIDALYRPSCITVGGADETVNVYAMEEDKQFQFTGKQVSIDGVKLVNENTFLTHGQDGSVCLWSTNRKRPLQHLKVTHGYIAPHSPEPQWVTALASLVNTDLAASGSGDGMIRLWRVDAQAHKLFALQRIAIPPGFVNSLEFTADGSKLVAAIGRTHKHGRWFVNKKAKNCVVVISLVTLEQMRSKPGVDVSTSSDDGNEIEVSQNGDAGSENIDVSEGSDEDNETECEQEENSDGEEDESGEDEKISDDDSDGENNADGRRKSSRELDTSDQEVNIPRRKSLVLLKRRR